LIRYLLYADWFDTEGLIVSSSQYHWAGDGKGTRQWIDGREYIKLPKGDPCPCTSWRWPEGEDHVAQALDAYEKVYPNLKTHESDYPTPEELRAKYKIGNVEFDGDMAKDTDGSNLIKQVLLDNNPDPVFLMAWGGQNTIARALQSIQLQYQGTPDWSDIYQKVSKKAILLPSGDQDDTGAKYIKPNWPQIHTGGQGSRFDLSGALIYGAQNYASETNKPYYSADWIKKNITDQGPLGQLYYTWGDGREMVKDDPTDYMWRSGYTKEQLEAMGYYVWLDPEPKGEFLGEGDTYTMLSLLGNGTRQYQDTNWGSYSSGQDFPYTMDEEATRLQWSVTPKYKNANHAPDVSVLGKLDLTAVPGQKLTLKGRASDPDKGQKVAYSWSEDTAIDSYPGTATLNSTAGKNLKFTVPTDARQGQTIHLLLQVTDTAPLPLARYQRIVITID
jgi:hypothetical protein